MRIAQQASQQMRKESLRRVIDDLLWVGGMPDEPQACFLIVQHRPRERKRAARARCARRWSGLGMFPPLRMLTPGPRHFDPGLDLPPAASSIEANHARPAPGAG